MILRFGLFLLPGLVLLGVLPGPAAGEGKPGLRAGAYAMDITPAKLPISVNGSMTDRQATAVHDRLHARCLILDDGKIELAIAVCDSCMMPREVLDDAKAQAARLTGIPPGRMLIAATHTHTAPTVAGVFQSDPDKDYQKFLAERIARGIEQAHKNRVPAQAGWGVAKEPTQVYNRRWHMKPGSLQADPFGRTTDKVKMNPGYQNPGLDRPAGPTDPDVAILSLRDRSEKPIALLANYSLHYVGGFPALSADYFGAFAERIGDTLGVAKTSPAFVGIMSNGTSGDVNNVDFAGMPPGKRQSGEQIRVVATSVAKVAAAACEKIDHTASVTLAMAEKEIELGVRRPGKEDLARAEELLASAKTPLRTPPEIYARETVLLAKYPPAVKVKIQAVRIGQLGIVAIPCEVFAEIGLDIKKKSPLKPTFTIELANGYNGYLPTPAQHQLGGYETWRARSSYLEVDASTKILKAVYELLEEVKK